MLFLWCRVSGCLELQFVLKVIREDFNHVSFWGFDTLGLVL